MKISLIAKKAIVEFLGAFIFLSALTASVSSGAPLAHLALATALGLAILITSGISGGHLNPAVSLVFYAKGLLSLRDFAVYAVAQIAGAFFGAFIGSSMQGRAIRGIGMDAMPTWSTIIGELFATGGLVFLIFFLIDNKRTAFIPAGVALWVFAAATFTQTGAQANPAVSLALTIADPGQGLGAASWYILAQLAGALIAMLFLMVFNAKVAKPAAKPAAKKKAVAKKK
jgi:arsenate reductase